MEGYVISEPCYGTVYTSRLGKLAIQIWVGRITISGIEIHKFVAPTQDCLVNAGDYVRIIQEVGDSRPDNWRRGVLFVSCERIEPEIRVDWAAAKDYHGVRLSGTGSLFHVSAPRWRHYRGVDIRRLENEEKECAPVGFKLVGNVPYFIVSPVEEVELDGVLRLADINAWPLSWRGLPGWEEVYRKWSIDQRSNQRLPLSLRR